MIAGLPVLRSLDSKITVLGCGARSVEADRQLMTDSFHSQALRGAVEHSKIRRPRNACLKVAVLAASALSIVACGGGDDDTSQAAVNPPVNPSGNTAPTISGTPLTSVMQNNLYQFTPLATDANGDPLTFSVLGKPLWATTFDTTNGKLSGTPTAGDVGNYPNIRITVTDGQVSTNLAAFSINVVATATGAATLTWTPPSTNTDGSALTDLANYRIYWGTAQNNYPNSKTVPMSAGSTAIVDQLTPATWYFVVTAVDTSGNESSYSNPAQKTVM